MEKGSLAPNALERKARLPGEKAQRGQLSLEALLVFLIFLVLLGIAWFSASSIGSAAQKKIGAEIARSDFEQFTSKLSSACFQGSGNVRTVEIRGGAASVSADGREFTFTEKDFSAAGNSSCEISVLQAGPSAQFTISNRGGKIEIS